MIINPMCPCGKEPEATLQSLNDICALNHFLKNISEESLLKVLLYYFQDKF